MQEAGLEFEIILTQIQWDFSAMQIQRYFSMMSGAHVTCEYATIAPTFSDSLNFIVIDAM